MTAFVPVVLNLQSLKFFFLISVMGCSNFHLICFVLDEFIFKRNFVLKVDVLYNLFLYLERFIAFPILDALP